MTPAEMAAAVYDREPCARSFREDLEAHLLNGYVFSTPELFMMGRAVRHDADPALIVNPWHTFEDADCWLIYLVAGCGNGIVSKFWTFEPRRLKFLAWERANRLRVYPADKVRRCTSLPFSAIGFAGRSKRSMNSSLTG